MASKHMEKIAVSQKYKVRLSFSSLLLFSPPKKINETFVQNKLSSIALYAY